MEFYFRQLGANPSSFSHLTVSEINGGLDGLLLSQYATDWQRHSELTLSQIVSMYYSAQGIQAQGSGPLLSACERYKNFVEHFDDGRLEQQVCKNKSHS